MELDLIAHISVSIPDELVAQLCEKRLPGTLQRLLKPTIDLLPVAVPLLVKDKSEVFITHLQLESVEWRADLASRVLRQVRDAASATQILEFAADYSQVSSVLDRRKSR